MTVELEAGPKAPPPLQVGYSAKTQLLRTFAILAVGAICLLIPSVAKEQGPESWRFALILVAAAVLWALWTFRRVRDRRPQVIVDESGVFVREWVVGTVPWENIEYIAHSSSIRRGLVASVTRTRRKPYLLFRFVETPKIKPTAPVPFSWLQFISAEFAIQEPVIQQYGLDTPVAEILEKIQAHIAYWQTNNGIE
mgnify:FL=1